MGTDEKPGIYFIWPYGPGFVASHENKEGKNEFPANGALLIILGKERNHLQMF